MQNWREHLKAHLEKAKDDPIAGFYQSIKDLTIFQIPEPTKEEIEAFIEELTKHNQTEK